MVRDRTAIVGIAQTEYVRNIGRSEAQTAYEVGRAALDDAGLTPQDLDGIFFVEGQDGAHDLGRRLGVENLRSWAAAGPGGGGACAPVVWGAAAVASGLCDVALAFRARNRGAPGGRPWAKAGGRVPGLGAFEIPHGLVSPVQQIALKARRYLHEFNAPEDCFARVSVAQRANAATNPAAYFREPITVDDVMNSRFIAEPLHLLECCPETDGAAAVIITTAERAKDLRHPPAYIGGVAQGSGDAYMMHNSYRTDPWPGSGDRAARDVYAMAGVGPADIDVVEMYDMFSPVVLWGLEAYGFCERGSAGDFVCDGNLDGGPQAVLPVNTHGGSLSEAYIHGFNHVPEAVRQIRGTSTCQVEGAEVVLVAAAPVVPTSAIILHGD
jgi:17-hydroxy-3-oxo-4-pregnene-20-carboxyl-CoA lyase